MNEIKYIFDSAKNFTHLPKDQPSISGKLIFVQELHLRAKKTAMLLTDVIQYDERISQQDFSIYIRVSKELFEFQTNEFKKWMNYALEIEQNKTRDTLLFFDENTKIFKCKFDMKLYK
ncbi:uncharacterized protein LOC126899786 [Daktulosphaira vitifoliae]|uniref:uncharacterized protein LOC126899786 n=1 Tax=Daktulosphaira vitifoliae TaxID=58002 RepID=UPI0021AADA66|nr:uncharacterized protein LOC126899786 [Daktulosphaira vitifoliae]